MKQSEALQFIPLLKAWGEGKTIQIKDSTTGRWGDSPVGGAIAFSLRIANYRVKPEPAYVWVVVSPEGRASAATVCEDIGIRWLGEAAFNKVIRMEIPQ